MHPYYKQRISSYVKSPSSSKSQQHPYFTHSSQPEEIIKCEECQICFRDESSWRHHLLHCRSQQFVCLLCSLHVSSIDFLEKHREAKHTASQCQYCNIQCPNIDALKRHIKREHEPNFVCSICSKTFRCKINYTGHMNMHSGAKPYSCSRCGKSFAYQQSKHAHEKTARGDTKSSGGKRGASELIGKFAAYECSYCSVILTEYEDLTLHSKNCPSPSCSMICLTCGEKLPNKPEMRQHLKLVHSHKTFGCKYCDMMFLSSSGLLSHTKAKHRPDAKTLCQLCGQAFHNKANLEGHMNMHLGIRPFKCKRCGKSYGHSKSLITHEKMCKSIISSPKTISAKGLGSQRGHVRSQIKTNTNTNSKGTPAVQEISKKNLERKEIPATPVPTESVQPQIVYETFQPTFVEGREEKRDSNSSERTMTLIPNANQNFTFTAPAADAVTYPQSFTEAVSQPSLVMTAMNSPNPTNVPMANTVYAHPNTSFVLPQVAYGMYQQGILPDQR